MTDAETIRVATDTLREARERIEVLEAALRDCIPFLVVNMDKYRRDHELDALHQKHAEILDRVSVLSGGEPLSERLK
ncbi:MAG: hypothetical protein ACOYLQ_15355 [Hyphomicrobiaceae bacterium]